MRRGACQAGRESGGNVATMAPANAGCSWLLGGGTGTRSPLLDAPSAYITTIAGVARAEREVV